MMKQRGKTDQDHWALKNYQEAEFILRGVPAISFLRDCWAQSVACKIHDPDRNAWQGGMICEIGATELNLELSGPDELSLNPGRVYLVSISRNGRVYGFAVRVLSLDHCKSGGPSRVKLELPRQISSSQVRRSLRIPTSWSMDFRLEFQAEEEWVPANLLDLSLGGFRALLQDRRIRDFEPGDSLPVRLRFADHEIEEVAQIVNKNGPSVGFNFFEFEKKNGLLEPSQAYSDLLLAVGDAWYRPRAEMPQYSKRLNRAFLVEWIDADRGRARL